MIGSANSLSVFPLGGIRSQFQSGIETQTGSVLLLDNWNKRWFQLLCHWFFAWWIHWEVNSFQFSCFASKFAYTRKEQKKFQSLMNSLKISLKWKPALKGNICQLLSLYKDENLSFRLMLVGGNCLNGFEQVFCPGVLFITKIQRCCGSWALEGVKVSRISKKSVNKKLIHCVVLRDRKLAWYDVHGG